MESTQLNPSQVTRYEGSSRREDGLVNSLISAFAATFALSAVMFAAYGIARGLGDMSGNQLQRWFWGLSHNSLTSSTVDSVVLAIALNLVVGLLWGLVYGMLLEPRLSGPGWRRGMVFGLVPWLLSITIFFPIMDAGIFGRDLGAGPLPVIGNLILHLVYGAVLGALFAVDLESWLDGSEIDRSSSHSAEQGAAIGVIAGLPVGALIGWLTGPSLRDVASRPIVALMGAILCAALGLMIGMFAGIERAGSRFTSQREIEARQRAR